MKINKENIIREFKEYTSGYCRDDTKIELKITHTYKVAGICERIADSLNLEPEDKLLAWTIGMLHDIGRFEQIRRFHTFVDAESVNHAEFGADLLFKDGLIGRFIEEADRETLTLMEEADHETLTLIEKAIRYHSLYKLPQDMDKRTQMFCEILRDADKVDIFRVNVEIPLEEIYNTTEKELKNSVVSDRVMDSFTERHATLRSLKRTPVDFVAGHISLVFELVFPESLRITLEQGYLEKLLHFQSENHTTQTQFQVISKEVREYIEDNGVSGSLCT